VNKEKSPAAINNGTGGAEPHPPPDKKRYRAKLDSVGDVKHEVARIYREARSGLLDTQDATKLVWCLQALGKIIEVSELERRIEALEGKHELKSKA
jgi:hypothetical protein